MKRTIILVVMAVMVGLSTTGCFRTIKKVIGIDEGSKPEGVEWVMPDYAFNKFKEYMAVTMRNDGDPRWEAILSMPKPKFVLMKPTQIHNGRPFFYIKDVGSVSGYYNHKIDTAYIAADEVDPSKIHPWIDGDWILIFHELQHAVLDLAWGQKYEGHPMHPIFKFRVSKGKLGL